MHFGHFTLTLALLPYIKEGGRIVHVSSFWYPSGKLDFDDLDYKKAGGIGLAGKNAYDRSKLCNFLFSRELAKRLKAGGRDIHSFSINPGLVPGTDLGKGPNRDKKILPFLAKALIGLLPVSKNLAQGASTQVFCATHEAVMDEKYAGRYFTDNDEEAEKGNTPEGYDKLAVQLFDVSLQLTNSEFNLEVISNEE